jgi:hypothetical protein
MIIVDNITYDELNNESIPIFTMLKSSGVYICCPSALWNIGM